MERANQLYRQYLEDARNLAKVGQDALTLQKAEAFAQIAAAIAATGFVEASVFEDARTASEKLREVTGVTPVTGKASLERKPEPKVVVGTVKPEDMPKTISTVPAQVPAWLNSQEFKALVKIEDEPADKKAERFDYLLKNYGSKQMKELPPETFPYFHLELKEMDRMKYFLETWNADVERWRIKAATEISGNRVTEINGLTVEEYLTKLIPAVGHLNYLLSFDVTQHDDLLAEMHRVNSDIKKLDDLRFKSVEFIRIGIDKIIDKSFDDVENVC